MRESEFAFFNRCLREEQLRLDDVTLDPDADVHEFQINRRWIPAIFQRGAALVESNKDTGTATNLSVRVRKGYEHLFGVVQTALRSYDARYGTQSELKLVA